VSRPNGLEARRRRDELARLIAEAFREGGYPEVRRNIIQFRKSVRIDADRLNKLLFEEDFIADVERMAGL
jgi:hypothetical protein